MNKIEKLPWSDKIQLEKKFVKDEVYKTEFLQSLFDEIGENMPEQLQTYITENPEARDGMETEIQVTNKHLSARATNSGRADLLIPFTTKDNEEHALWIETMDKSGKWDWIHHEQWKKKITSFMERYDKVIPMMIADKFDDNWIKNFDKWNNKGFDKTHAIELNFQKIKKEWGFNINLKTDSYEDNKSYQGGLTNSQLENRNFYQKLASMFENTDIEVYSSESEATNGYYRVKLKGDWTGFYLRRYAQGNSPLSIVAQNSEYTSKHKHEVYEMIKHSSEDVKQMMRDCGNIELAFKDAKDPQLVSKLSSVEDAKRLIETFNLCVMTHIDSK
ncbi:MAG: hypothetical protein CMC65_07340 [Flavobacteriaceae bacterium]|nr:hypothetical protein [Flavobacteriaceae bacterium]|tara:strand:- start:169 stop:1161 length:993 start_codon:yes stop_codon:yes gene_type:complete